jgi:F-type H+-transporting ATPase subunit b
MRVWLLMGLSAVLLLVAADPCFASGDGGERNMFEKALDLGIWTLVVFLLLLLVLTRYAWKPMLEGLARREQDIASAVAESKKAREEAAELRKQLAEDRLKNQEQIRQMFEEARQKADQLKEKAKTEAAADIDAERARLLRELKVAGDQLRKELTTHMIEVATLIASKALHRNLPFEIHHGLVDEALAELNSAVEQRQRALSGGSKA